MANGNIGINIVMAKKMTVAKIMKAQLWRGMKTIVMA